jgi:acetoacetyl-CoA synthetase
MASNYEQFLSLLASRFGRSFNSYEALHHFSITEQGLFWQMVATYFKIEFSVPPEHHFVPAEKLWQTKYFAGAQLSYSAHLIRHACSERPALIFKHEQRYTQEISWAALLKRAAFYQQKLNDLGVKKGDRVAALCTNSPETVAAFLATNSLGAIWSSCAVEFGYDALFDRFSGIEPKIVFAHDHYHYAAKRFELKVTLKKLQENLKSLESIITLDSLNDSEAKAEELDDLKISFAVESVEFDHPIYILFSSGTTGKPKAIVHTTGAMLLEHCKALGIHQDVKQGERYFWYSTTGWMMWNYSLSSLALGATLCLYDGASNYPDDRVLWSYASEKAINHFGHGAAFYGHMAETNHSILSEQLTALRTLGSTGSVLLPHAYNFMRAALPQAEIQSISGGTDVCTAFVGGLSSRSAQAGEIACKMLGAAVEIYNQDGLSIVDKPGELVLTKPFIAFPLGFWNDHEHIRFEQSYFSTFKNVWKHGDWAQQTKDHRIVIFGRSDATLNRGGVRIGTAEIYEALAQLDTVEDALIIHLFNPNVDSLLLFVVSKINVDGNSIRRHLQQACSPRHKPDLVFQVAAIPYTLNGKKIEIPVKRILEGEAVEKVISLASVKNPESLYAFEALRPQLKTHINLSP